MLDITKLQKLRTNLSILGFKAKTIHSMYVEDALEAGFNIKVDSELSYYLYLCEVQKWLRDIHNIDFIIEFIFSEPNNYGIFINSFGWVEDDQKEIIKFNSYEEALLEGIEESLKLIKQ